MCGQQWRYSEIKNWDCPCWPIGHVAYCWSRYWNPGLPSANGVPYPQRPESCSLISFWSSLSGSMKLEIFFCIVTQFHQDGYKASLCRQADCLMARELFWNIRDVGKKGTEPWSPKSYVNALYNSSVVTESGQYLLWPGFERKRQLWLYFVGSLIMSVWQVFLEYLYQIKPPREKGWFRWGRGPSFWMLI